MEAGPTSSQMLPLAQESEKGKLSLSIYSAKGEESLMKREKFAVSLRK